MIADTTFVSDLLKERRKGQHGPASKFLVELRGVIRTTIITVGELAVLFDDSSGAFEWLGRWKIYRLNDGIVKAAADVDRALISRGQRLGENDNWIAGFCAYYREPIISHDAGFDRVPGIRRVVYQR